MLVIYKNLTIILKINVKYNNHSVIYALNVLVNGEDLTDIDRSHFFKRRKKMLTTILRIKKLVIIFKIGVRYRYVIYSGLFVSVDIIN